MLFCYRSWLAVMQAFADLAHMHTEALSPRASTVSTEFCTNGTQQIIGSTTQLEWRSHHS
jgi:hypothetical protein